MNLLKLDTIRLDDQTIDDLGRWHKVNHNNPIVGITVLDEGLVEYEMMGKTIDIYFKDETDFYSVKMFVNGELFTKWEVEKLVVNNQSFGIRNIPSSHEDLDLIRTMTSVWANALSYLNEFHDNSMMVEKKQIKLKRIKKGSKQPSYYTKNVYYLTIPLILPFAEDRMDGYEEEVKKKFPMGVTLERLELDPSESLDNQINSTLDSYYKGWLETSIPALNGKTPIQAAKTEAGREELENLFQYIRRSPSTIPFPEYQMRKALGM